MMSSFRGCFEVDFGLSLGRILCHVYGRFVVLIGVGVSPVERVVSEMTLGQKNCMYESSKGASGTQLRRFHAAV